MKVGDSVVERPHASGVRRIYKENLHDDAADTLKALLPLTRRKDDRDWSNFSDSTSMRT